LLIASVAPASIDVECLSFSASIIIFIVQLVENLEDEEDLQLAIVSIRNVAMEQLLKVLLADYRVSLTVNDVDRHTIDVLEENVPVLVLWIVVIKGLSLVLLKHATGCGLATHTRDVNLFEQ